MTTSVPQIVFTPTGLDVPVEADILAGVQADMQAAFGGNLNFGTTAQPGGAPPQVQQASSYGAIIADAYGTFAEFVAQIDPDNATGFMQDAIARIYFLNREPGEPTTVQLACVGALGTPITAGTSQAQDTSGNIYVCTQTGTIGASGTITLPFANIVVGPVPAPAGTVNRIYQGPSSWNTVTNPADGIEGSDVETPADFEFRRQNTVAANAHGSLPSIYGSVFEVPGVIDLYAFENVTGSPIVVGSTNYTLVDHSIFIGVIGGAAQDIANAIWTKKNEGSNMNGNTTETVVDNSGYSFPQPSYPITYNNNAENPVVFNFIVTIVNSTALPSTIEADVDGAVNQQFNGITNTPLPSNGVIPKTSGTRVRIGSLMLAAAFYGAVTTCEGPTVPVQVLSILIGSVFSGHATVVNGSDVLTVTGVTSGSLSAGTVLTGTDIPAGASIVQQLTGSVGGIGTYQMSANATGTVGAPEVVTGAGGTAQLIGIDQAPEVGTVTVVLV